MKKQTPPAKKEFIIRFRATPEEYEALVNESAEKAKRDKKVPNTSATIREKLFGKKP
jgi:hypothetical protein